MNSLYIKRYTRESSCTRTNAKEIKHSERCVCRCVLLQLQILFFYYFFVILDFILSVYNELYVLTVKTRECRKNSGDNQFHILISCSAFPPWCIICSHPSPISARVWGWGCVFGGGGRDESLIIFLFIQTSSYTNYINLISFVIFMSRIIPVSRFSIFTVFNGQMF